MRHSSTNVKRHAALLVLEGSRPPFVPRCRDFANGRSLCSVSPSLPARLHHHCPKPRKDRMRHAIFFESAGDRASHLALDVLPGQIRKFFSRFHSVLLSARGKQYSSRSSMTTRVCVPQQVQSSCQAAQTLASVLFLLIQRSETVIALLPGF